MRPTWNGVERLAVDLGVEQERDEVVARVGDVILDLRLQVVEQLLHADGPLLQRERHAFEHVVDEAAERVGVLLGQAEHVGDHAHRDVLGVVARGVDDVAGRRMSSISSSQ